MAKNGLLALLKLLPNLPSSKQQMLNSGIGLGTQHSGLEEWQSWRQTFLTPIAANPAGQSAGIAIKWPIFANKIDKIDASSSLY